MFDLELRPTWAEIDLDALVHNFQEVRRIVSQEVKILAVVKADAYGHGALESGKTLLEAGADALAVAFIDEAIALRQNGITDNILLLGYSSKGMIKDLLHWDLTPTVYQLDFAKALSDYCKKAALVCPIHIKIDTGMGRIGFSWQEASRMIEEISKLPGLLIEGVYSHFSTADEGDKAFTMTQWQRFRQILDDLKAKNIAIPLAHIANSAGLFDLEGLHLDMVRPGIVLYGLYPSDAVDRRKIDLKPVMRFKTRIIHIKKIQAGDPLSYGRSYVAKEERLIGTLAVGYADGLPRLLSDRGTVFIKGQELPILGNICMDQCMVDLSDLEKVDLYDEVEIFGDHILVDDIAKKIGTINYELICMVNKRVPRLYLKDGKAAYIKRRVLGKQEY